MVEKTLTDKHHSDDNLYEEIVAAIERLPFVRESRPQINITVEDGVVMVEGNVISEIIRQGLLWAASTASGVKEVVDKLHTDTELRVAVARALTADPALTKHRIFVTTYQGIVTLAGKVSSKEERKNAVKMTSGVEGVRSVAATLIVAA